MKVHFKYPRSLNGQHYAPGIHEIPGHFSDHWFFKALVESKDAEVLELAITAGSDTHYLIKDEIAVTKDGEGDVSEPKVEKPKRSKKS